MKTTLTPEEQGQITRFFAVLSAMRKYQKAFFKGDKGALKNSIFYEKEVDAQATVLIRDLFIEVPTAKGGSTQTSLL